MKNAVYITAATVIVLIFSIILGFPTLIGFEWLTSASNAIKSFLILHIEFTVLIMVIAFIILLHFSSSGNVYDFFDTSKYSEAISKKLDSARQEYTSDHKNMSSKLSTLNEDIHNNKRELESVLEKTVYKVKLLENELSYHYKDAFRYTHLISSSILKITNHTKLKECTKFAEVSNEYQKSVRFLGKY